VSVCFLLRDRRDRVRSTFFCLYTKFCGEVERGPSGRNRLGCVGDPVSFVDPGSFSPIAYH